MPSRIDAGGFNPLGQITTSSIEDGALAATPEGRAKLADGFFDRTAIDKFTEKAFLAVLHHRLKFADGFVDTRLLADLLLSADKAGRKKMAPGFLAAEALDKFATATFTADNIGRSKFADGFIATHLVMDGLLAATASGRLKMAANFFNEATVTAKFEDRSISEVKLKLVGQTYDFSAAVALRASDPVGPSDVVTKAYLEANTSGNLGGPEPWVSYRRIDLVADAVPGQANTYYIDKGATALGHSVRLTEFGEPEVQVIRNGRQLLWVPEADLGNPSIPGDFTVVRSQSTGPEGPAPVDALNALTFTEPLTGDVWVNYRPALEEQFVWHYYRVIDKVADAVPGQAEAFYIDKGATALGHNVLLDSNDVPEIRLIHNGRDLLWVEEADLGNPLIPGDFSVVRSLSTGPEGQAASGSTNAIKLALSPPGDLWVHYRRKGLATP